MTSHNLVNMSVFLRPNFETSVAFSVMVIALLAVYSFDSFGNCISFVGLMIETSSFCLSLTLKNK